MIRKFVSRLLLIAVAWAGLQAGVASALDVIWDGGEGFWDDPKWNGGMFAQDLSGRPDGSNGFASPNGGETFIISGEGSSVTYEANLLDSDFRLKQGSSLRIENGATWIQPTEDFWAENHWTEFDGSGLIIDGGAFIRQGEAPLGDPGDPLSGGALIFGSWMSDDNLTNPLSVLDHPEIDISITNGGRLENEGQLWFGSWGDQAPGLVVDLTINDGALDLTGGHVNPTSDAFFDGDLSFTFDRDNLGMPKGESYSINFTGPGSITVDNGIVVATKDETNAWTGGGFQSYEDLWNLGILQANGMSGLDGANFNDFFSVTGAPIDLDYTLTSLVTPPGGVAGDYNGNGRVEQADLDLVLLNWGTALAQPWVDGTVDQAELDGVLLNWGNEGALGSAAGVPEPATWLLVALAAALAACKVRYASCVSRRHTRLIA